MVNIADPVTQWAFAILVSVLAGTCLLTAVAIFRRWTQIRYARHVHSLQRQYRPTLAKVLTGAPSPSRMKALRNLPLAELEILLDPLFSKRKLPERCRVFLQALCVELGLIRLWHARLARGWSAPFPGKRKWTQEAFPGRVALRYLLRAKSIRNLGTLRHQPSWPLLAKALDDPYPDIQLVALRSLAELRAPESFPVLRHRLHAVVQGRTLSPPVQGLQAAMASFALACAPSLLPSLRHPDRQIRLRGCEILRTMVCREAARQPDLTLTPELLTPPLVKLLLSGLAIDTCPETRARAAEVIVYLTDPAATAVLRNLLLDPQWFVRLRTVRALAHMRAAAAPLHRDVCERLRDAYWRVREAAIKTLISLGPEGKRQLYEYFLISPNRNLRDQVVEVIERTGLMSALLEGYSAGKDGAAARLVERLASDAAPIGLSGVLRTLNPEIRQKFLLRFAPHAPSEILLPGKKGPGVESVRSPARIYNSPPCEAA